jgi:hypothetical protein
MEDQHIEHDVGVDDDGANFVHDQMLGLHAGPKLGSDPKIVVKCEPLPIGG